METKLAHDVVKNDVVQMSMRCNDVASTSVRRHFFISYARCQVIKVVLLGKKRKTWRCAHTSQSKVDSQISHPTHNTKWKKV